MSASTDPLSAWRIFLQDFPMPSFVVDALIDYSDEARSALCQRQTLSDTQIERLWRTKKKDVATASALASRPLRGAVRTHVIAKERRVRVLGGFLAHNTLSFDEASLLLSWPKVYRMALAVSQACVDSRLQEIVRPLLRDSDLLRWLVHNAETIEAADVTDILSSFDTHVSRRFSWREVAHHLRAVIECWPECVSAVLHKLTPESVIGNGARVVLSSLAGSRHLNREADQEILVDLAWDQPYTMLAFVNNPRVGQEILDVVLSKKVTADVRLAVDWRRVRRDWSITDAFEQVSSSRDIQWILRRSSGPGKPTRLEDLLALLSNPNLSNEEIATIGNILISHDHLLSAKQLDNVTRRCADGVLMQKDTLEGASCAHREEYQRGAGAAAFIHSVCECGTEHDESMFRELIGTDQATWVTLVRLLEDPARNRLALRDLVAVATKVAQSQ